MPDRQKPFDTHIDIVTPENIMFHYRVAGPFRRLPAYLIDLTIQTAVISISALLLILVFGMASIVGVGVGLFLIVLFIMNWFYGGLFETFWNGQTPGKRMMQIRVLSIDGQPIRGLQAVLRNILRTVDALPTVYLYCAALPTGPAGGGFERSVSTAGRLGQWHDGRGGRTSTSGRRGAGRRSGGLALGRAVASRTGC